MYAVKKAASLKGKIDMQTRFAMRVGEKPIRQMCTVQSVNVLHDLRVGTETEHIA